MTRISYYGQSPRRCRGISLVEILVIIGIIGLLMGILLPSMAGAKRSTRLLSEQNNMRAISVGMQTYSTSNNDAIISPNTERSFDGGTFGTINCPAWVNAIPAHLVEGGDPGQLHETPEALMTGAGATFVGDGGFEGGVYRSPFDTSDRLRSFSLNGVLGEHPDVEFLQVLESLDLPQAPIRMQTQARKPDSTLFVIPEEMRGVTAYNGNGGWNYHGFMIDLYTPVWSDIPAYWCGDGINLSFIDGSFEYYYWDDPALPKQVDSNGTTYAGFDYEYFRDIMLPNREDYLGN